MTFPIPPGTRDVLPEEMRELRAISDRLRAVFEDGGYGEVYTPALEYEDVLRRGDARAAGAAYRLFGDNGEVLTLRSDTTIPIARVVATRYQDVAPPYVTGLTHWTVWFGATGCTTVMFDIARKRFGKIVAWAGPSSAISIARSAPTRSPSLAR